MKNNDECLREVVIAFGKSNPYFDEGELICIQCNSLESHKEDCPWLEANKIVQEIESGYFDAQKCRYVGIAYGENECDDEYIPCRNTIDMIVKNDYCTGHQEYYKKLMIENERYEGKK